MAKYPQIRRGQVWRDPDTGDTITVDDVHASDTWNNGKWRAMVRYTVSDGRDADVTTADEFGDWIRKYRLELVEPQPAVSA